ncbi:MAG TPA: lysophospholipid acyltransferase family protein [Burkholderiaceae bacterium]|jgi:1-acyl-sn-glycerol-3-phosphate acyltransferase|nr:lysophospholipid acyltransferase family protein [Burkholderiaceae bacterium]
MIGQLYRLGLWVIAPITIAAAFLHVGLGLLYATLLFPWIRRSWRDAAVMVWSRLLLLIIGVRLESTGLPPRPGGVEGEPPLGSLLLINHTSWLDVFSIAAVVPARFVSKAEIGRWPVLGWLAIVVGTLFVERGRRHAVMRTNQAVAERLRSGQLIGIFPEGTTTDGSRLLPFHANLVQPAIDLGAPVQPVGVRFTQRGEFSRAAMFVGEMNLMHSMWRVVTAPNLAVELYWLPPIDPLPTSRHLAARAARVAIADALNVPLEEHERLAGEVSPAAEPSDTEPGPWSAPAS